MNLFNYSPRSSHAVKVGNTTIGGGNPLRLQSMTTTLTTDTEASVEQCIRIIEAGADLVRLTTQGLREAENLRNIRAELDRRGYHTPLVADVHFNPKVADLAATIIEKVRVNPGNYVDPARTFKSVEYTDEEYAAELQRLETRFKKLLAICRENGTAIRIGVNHGSLSDRIMCHYGDTPAGIVESCMEFLRVCMRENFFDVVISIKASNTVVMVQSMRLLVDAMKREGMSFPLHLGVTEAGEGEDGRIKSAVGIGALLADGIGDTIRISLTPEPGGDRSKEVVVAQEILQSLGLRSFAPMVVACPGCGRTSSTFFQELADRIQRYLREQMPVWSTQYPGVENMNVAVMGCIVNGPGESKHADIGISLPGADESPVAPVYIDGERTVTLKGDHIAEEFQAIVENYVERRYGAKA